MMSQMRAALTTKFKDKWLSVTADIWSARRRSFFGMTAHFINNELKRESFGISCKRFTGGHTFDKIAEMITDNFENYGIPSDRVTYVVTDNGSNFVKAFQEFGPSQDDAEIEEEGDEEAIVFRSLNEEENSATLSLPRRHRCASHTLSLVAKTDSLKTTPNTIYTKLLHSSMGKCSALWNKSNRPKSAEIIQNITGGALTTPNATRWNSTYDAICRLLQFKANLDDLCRALDLPTFKRPEIEFLEDYVNALKPIAVALDILQGDRGNDEDSNRGRTFMGTLAPAILSVHSKLQELEPTTVKPLVDALIVGINERFSGILTLDLSDNDVRHACIASMSHPYFKLRWIPLTAMAKLK
jgi:hypothetical protein